MNRAFMLLVLSMTTALGFVMNCQANDYSLVPTRGFSPEADLAAPALPACLKDQAAVKAWVEKTVYDTPPAGGIIKCLKASEPKYLNNMWIVTAVVAVTSGPEAEHPGVTQHMFAGVGYDPATGKSEIGAAIIIPEERLDEFLKGTIIPNSPYSDTVTVIEI